MTMQYGQPPTPQQPVAPYGQPVPGQPAAPYGQPAPYGAPVIGGPIGMPPAEIKWSGLEVGGQFHLPVIAFIGRLTEMLEDVTSQYGLRIVEKFDQVQILESPVPWPWATIDPSIKYSSKENSAWGHHIASAKALGLAVNAATLTEAKADLIGKIYEMRQTEQAYGEDRQTGQATRGNVWRFTRIVVPGQVQSFPQPQYAQPQPAVQPAVGQPAVGVPVAQPVTQAPTPTPAVQPAAPAVAIPAVAAAPATPTAFITTLDPSDTAAVRAKKLLHGRALNEWLGVALIDDKIKADPSFINTIYDQSFIVGLKASNQVTQGADGKFVVVA